MPFPQAPAGAQRMVAIRLALVLWEVMLVMFLTYDQYEVVQRVQVGRGGGQ